MEEDEYSGNEQEPQVDSGQQEDSPEKHVGSEDYFDIIDYARDRARTLTYIETPESSNIGRFAYDPVSQYLYIVFQSKGLHGYGQSSQYVYFDVPQQVVSQLDRSVSRGKFVNEYIKSSYGNQKIS